MRWIPIGTTLFACRLIVLHITTRNWLSLILSKPCFASNIIEGGFYFEIIMTLYKSIPILLAIVLNSLVTIVLVNHRPCQPSSSTSWAYLVIIGSRHLLYRSNTGK
jgi:hypothetical protein